MKDERFYDPLTRSSRWISDVDASRYFELREALLERMSVHLVFKRELRGSAEFGELMNVGEVPKRWLYQVYACASWIGTECGTVNEALRDFLRKNQRREREIWDELGFGS